MESQSITVGAGRKRRAIGLLAAMLIVTAVLGACGTNGNAKGKEANAEATATAEASPAESPTKTEAPAEPYPMKMMDELGHEVVLQQQPTNIFAPVMEDSLLALGVKPAAQWSNGVSPQMYLQDQLAGVPETSFASGLPSPEALASIQPDFIILNNKYYAENGVYEQYAKIAPTFVFENSSADLAASIRVLGELLNIADRAEAAISEYEAKVAYAKTKLAGLAEGKKAAIIRFNARGMFFLGGDHYSGYVLAQNLGFGESKLVKDGAFEVSLEVLPELDADYIFLVNDGNQGDEFVKQLKESAIWKSIPAVKAGQLFETSSDYWLSGGYIAQGKVIDDVLAFLAP